MYIHTYIYIYVYIYIYIYIHTYICICPWARSSRTCHLGATDYGRLSQFQLAESQFEGIICKCIYIYIYVCMYVCMYVYIYIYVHIYIYIYIILFLLNSFKRVSNPRTIAYFHFNMPF